MKPTDRYDANDLRAIEATGRMDSNESVHFARQLEFIKSQAYDVKRPKLSALALMPVSTDIPEGASTHTYRQYDTVGMAKIISNYADDMPRAEVTAKEFTGSIKSIGVSYGYNVQEIRASIFASTNLDVRKMRAAQRSHEELINKLAWQGDDANQLPGFLTNANIPAYVVPADGTGSSKAFADKTPDQIIRDLNGFVHSIRKTTKDVHRVTELWLPVDQYTYISTTPRSDKSDVTILDFFVKNQPDSQKITVKSVVELDGAGAAGADMMVALENNNENFSVEIPMMFRQYAPQLNNLEYTIPCESRFAGVVVRYPLAFSFATGI